MKRKRLFASVLATSMLMGLWGCGGSGKQETTPAETAAGTKAAETQAQTTAQKEDGEQVTLRMSWWGDDSRHAATIAAVELYESTHPGVKIELEYSSWDGYMDKVMTQLAGGTQPDIMQIQATAAMELTDSFPNTFVALDSQDILDMSAFNQVMEDSFCRSAGGQIVAVPTGINSYNILVNKTVTNAAGVELPKNMTWDEFFEYGKKIHEANPDSEDNCQICPDVRAYEVNQRAAYCHAFEPGTEGHQLLQNPVLPAVYHGRKRCHRHSVEAAVLRRRRGQQGAEPVWHKKHRFPDRSRCCPAYHQHAVCVAVWLFHDFLLKRLKTGSPGAV